MSKGFPLCSPLRIDRRENGHGHSFTPRRAAAALRQDGSVGTVFMLISIEDPADSARRVVTPASFARFLSTMKVSGVTDDLITELVVATAKIANSAAKGGRSGSAPRMGVGYEIEEESRGKYGDTDGGLPTLTSGRKLTVAHSDEVTLSEEEAMVLLETMPNTVSILLDRCDLLADMSEHPFAVARIEESLSDRNREIALLEEDRLAIMDEMEAVIRKTSALEASAAPSSPERAEDGSAVAGDTNHANRFGPSVTLRNAEAEQRQRLASLQVAARQAADSIEHMTNTLQSAIEIHGVREKDADEAERQLKSSEKRLWEHTTAMVEIEEAYLAAKARFEQSIELQRQLNREKQSHQETAENARRLLAEAEEAAVNLEREILSAKADLEMNLSVEIRETQRIVQSLEMATRSTAPITRKDRHVQALRNEYKALQEKVDEAVSRITKAKDEAVRLTIEKQQLERAALRYDAWLSYGGGEKLDDGDDQQSKAYEDAVLSDELTHAVKRRWNEVEALEELEGKRRSHAQAPAHYGQPLPHNRGDETQQLLDDLQAQYKQLRYPVS